MAKSNGFIETTKKYIADRLTSPFWVTYGVSWCIWNWEILYITFFTDATMLLNTHKMLKIDYIKELHQWRTLQEFLWSSIDMFGWSFIATFVVIFILPKIITIPFYERSIKNDNEEKIIKEQQEEEFLKKKTSKLEAEEKVIKKEHDIDIKKTKTQKTQDEKWDEEYRKFKKSIYYKSFNTLRYVIWRDHGDMRSIDNDAKAFFDVNDIIEINTVDRHSTAKLTEKGFYFMKKFMNKQGGGMA